MSLSPFLGCISNKLKIKYLLPEVGSAVKLSGEWYKRFWFLDLKIKNGRPSRRSTTPSPQEHVK